MIVKNRSLASPLFWKAFNKLMDMADLNISDKLSLVKVKVSLDNEIIMLRETVKGASVDHQNELLDKETDIDFKPVDVNLELLTAEELYQLQGFYKEII